MKQQQAGLEQLLAKERRAIRVKHDEKVKVARAKLVISSSQHLLCTCLSANYRARIFGAGLSKHEADVKIANIVVPAF